MFLSIILLGGGLCSILTALFSDWINHWYDLWILILAFIVGSIVTLFLLLVFVSVTSLFIKDKEEQRQDRKFYQRMVKRACEFFLQVSRVKLYRRGIEKIPQDKRFLFVCNHQSNYDSIAVIWTLRYFTMPFIMKESLFHIPFGGGRFLYGAGYMGLDRKNARQGVQVINHAASLIKDDIASVSICPEGTRSKSYEMGEFHHGSFKIATKAHCPIVVGVIQNTSMIHKRFPFKSTNVYFDICDVIEYETYKDMNTEQISNMVKNMIQERLDTLPKYEVKKEKNNEKAV